jgi:hypothetical protein
MIGDETHQFHEALERLAAHRPSPDPVAERYALTPWFRPLIFMPSDIDRAGFRRFARVVGGYIAYRSAHRHEVYPGLTTQEEIRGLARECFFRNVTSEWLQVIERLPTEELGGLMAPLFHWIETEADDDLAIQAIYGGLGSQPPVRVLFEACGRRFEEAGRRQPGWVDDAFRANGLQHRFAGRKFHPDWSWPDQGDELMEFMTDRSAMVRAEAARIFGIKVAFAIGAAANAGNRGVPSAKEAFAQVDRLETSRGCVVKGFLDGFSRLVAILAEAPAVRAEVLQNLKAHHDLDVTAWVIETCRRGFSDGDFTPNVANWSSLMLHFFNNDAAGVKMLIDADLSRYALMAVQWCFDRCQEMIPQLIRLMDSRDEDVRHGAQQCWDMLNRPQFLVKG